MYFQTESGRRRLLDKLAELEKTIQRKKLELKTHRAEMSNAGGNFSRRTIALEAELTAAIGAKHRLEATISECRRVRAAPEPTDTATVQLNHIVTVRHTLKVKNKSPKEKTLTFEMGGHGEEDASMKPPVVSYTQHPWHLFLKMFVGDIIETNDKKKKIVEEYEILHIQLRSEYKTERKRARAA